MANEFKIKYGAIIEGTVTVTGGNIVLDDYATVDGMDPSVHIDINNGSAHQIATTSLNGFMSSGDKTKLDGLQNYTHPNHHGDVTSSGDGATVIANEVIDNDNIAPNAAIATTKLADGTTFLRAGGTVKLTANWNINAGTSWTITGVPNPVNDSDIANKAWVLSVATGFNLKDPVKCATTANITLSGTQTIDGVPVSAGDRVLVKDQTNPKDNGIYVVSASAWSRSTDANDDGSDANANNDVTVGMSMYIEGGTANGYSSYALSEANPLPLDLGTSSLKFTLFARTGEIMAGNGLTKSGLTISAVGTTDRITVGTGIDIASNYVGQTSITTLGTIGTGTWNATAISAIKGGTGLTSYTAGDTIYASATNTLAKLAKAATGNVLLSGDAPSWGKVGLTTHISGTLAIANGGTAATSASAAFNNLSPMTKLGDIIYGGTSGAGTALVGNTANNTKFLASTGDGSSASAPAWRTLSVSHILDLNATISTALNNYTGSATISTVGTITSGTWFGLFGAVSGANLTNLTAANLSGTIPSGVLGNSTLYVGTTAVALNRSSADQALTGISSITFPGSNSGTTTLKASATAGTTTITMPATTGTMVTTGDIGTVTSAMIANSTIVNEDINASAAIAISKLAASTISGVSLGNNLANLTIGTGLTGTSYNGSNVSTIAIDNTVVLTTSAIGSTVQGYDADLQAIGTLSGTSGFLKKTAANTWSLDTSTYLTGNQSITISGDASGSGTTAISLALANSGVTAGTYNNSATQTQSFTVDAKGRITATGVATTITPAWTSITSKPTTLNGYGITDAQPLDTDLTAIAALTGVSGFLKTNGSGTWSVDTATYLSTSGGTLSGAINMGGHNITNIGSTTYNSSTIITSAVNGKITHTHSGSTPENLVQIPYADVDAIIFEYVAYNGSKNAVRAGVFIVTHNAGVDPQTAHYTTNDSGGSTENYVLRVDVIGNDIYIQAAAPVAGWIIKGYVRTL